MLKQARRLFASLTAPFSGAARSRNYRADFEQVETFCLFVGHPRSGHSLVGALIDAHPEAVISHELDALEVIERGVTRQQLWTLILKNSHNSHAKGRRDAMSPYVYTIPGQYQGRYLRLRVIGDKKGGRTTWRLANNPALIDRVLEMHAGIGVTLIHVTRNPFDNIATMTLRNGLPLRQNVEAYFRRCRTILNLHARPELRILDTAYENLITHPKASLENICRFLNLVPDETYLQDCTRILFNKPNLSRRQVEWPEELVEEIMALSQDFPFLQGYQFEAPDSP